MRCTISIPLNIIRFDCIDVDKRVEDCVAGQRARWGFLEEGIEVMTKHNFKKGVERQVILKRGLDEDRNLSECG